MKRAIVALGFTLFVAGACHRAPPPLPAPRAVPDPPAPAPVSATVAGPTGAPLTLAEQLEREAATRPRAAMSAETVAAALSAGGVPVGPLKQVLARPLGARYCALGRTPAGLIVSLCEFDDD